SIFDLLYFSLYGVSSEGLSFSSYVYFVIVFLGFIYLYQLKLHNTLQASFYYEVIRYRSYIRWFWKHTQSIGLSTFIMLIIYLGLITIIGTIAELSWSATLTAQ